MASIKSIRSTMGWEQKAVEQQTKMDQEAIGDEESASQAATADTNADGVEVDEMEEWVAGDKTITTHNHFHPKADAAPAQTSATTSAPTATTSAPAASNSVLPTLLVGAAMLAGGTGLGYVVNDLLKPQPPDAVSTGIDTDTTLGIHLPP